MKLVAINSGWLIALMAVTLAADSKCIDEGLPRSYLRQKRAVNPITILRNWWTGNNGKRLVPLDQYPLWKVHKYNGISLNPVAVVDSSPVGVEESLPEISGTPPPVVKVSHPTYSPPDDLEPPRTVYDPPSYTAPQQYEPRQPDYRPPQPSYGVPTEYGTPAPVYSPPQPSYGVPTEYGTPAPVYSPPQTYGVPSEYGTPAPVYQTPPPTYALPETYGPPSNEIDVGISNNVETSEPALSDTSLDSDTSGALNALDSLGSLTSFLPGSDSGSGGLDLATLAKIATSLPAGSVEKLVALLDLYNAKNNQQRVNALSDAASATVKLKAGAATAASHLIEDVFLGKDGDKGVLALESGTYSNVPSGYPGRPGLLPMIPPFSGTSRNIPLPSLPEPPPLPAIPFLSGIKNLINPPKLPHIYFPSTYTLPKYKAKGSYVSIRLPKPVTTYNIPNEPLPTETPAPLYEVPTVHEKLPDLYKLPYPEAIPTFNEIQTYSAPSTPAPIYGTPVSSSYSVSQGDSNSFQPSASSGYVVGEVKVAQAYDTPSVGFNHNTYTPKNFAVPSTSFEVRNDIAAAASEYKEKVSRSAQELNTGYSQVILQNHPVKKTEQPERSQENDKVDLTMYLDRNHPASTQQIHEQMRKEDMDEQDKIPETDILKTPSQ